MKAHHIGNSRPTTMMTLFRGLKKTSVVAALVASLTAAIPGVAGATPMLFLSTSSGTVTQLVTGGVNGFLSFSSTSFGDLAVVTANGLSKPMSGTAAHPLMHLDSLNLASNAGATIDLWFNDNDFSGVNQLVTLNSAVGGGGHGSAKVTFSAYVDTGNHLLSGTYHPGVIGYTPGTLVASIGQLSLSGSPFSFNRHQSGTFGPTPGQYAITMKAQVVLDPGAQVSFDHLVSVPDPGTILLLGAGMLGLAGANRRNRRKNQAADQD